jgi:hypothetical protein
MIRTASMTVSRWATLFIAFALAAGTAAGATFPEVEPNDSIATGNAVPNADDVTGFRCLPGLVQPGDPGVPCPGTADIDFFVYTGLAPERTYDLTLDNTVLGIGWFAENGTLLDSVAFVGFPELTDLVPSEAGELIIGVCGHESGQSVFDCSETSVGAGPYLLILPEPGAGALVLTALCVLAALRSRATPRP